MRLHLAIALALLSGCVCKPLDCKSGSCVDEATAVSSGLANAERQWLETGGCDGPMVGASGEGVWVNAGALASCGRTNFFDRNGNLRASRRCCEGNCTEFGVGFRAEKGPVVRDLCIEARAGLFAIGTGLYASEAIEVRDDDGGVPPLVTASRHRRWLLQPGTYEVFVRERASLSRRFEVPADGGVVIARDGAEALRCGKWHCELPLGPGATSVTFSPALVRADGGTR